MQVHLKKKPTKKQQFVAFIMVRKRCGQKSQGILAAGQQRFICALGRGGISAQKREGDGATPLATMALLGGFRRQGLRALPAGGIALKRVGKRDGWCDAVGDANYNRPVRLPYRASAEHMQRSDSLYDVGMIADWNISRRIMGRGSAIFMHLARQNYQPTEGCIALSRRDMERLLPHVSRATKIRISR
ncbi:L,D-transpeptidase family protein [Bartonella sp. LJL80]